MTTVLSQTQSFPYFFCLSFIFSHKHKIDWYSHETVMREMHFDALDAYSKKEKVSMQQGINCMFMWHERPV